MGGFMDRTMVLREKWAITRAGTDELIETYLGTFMETSNYVNKYYEDGAIDVELYDEWSFRQWERG